jgi:signal transduction histidine kinase
LDQLPGNHNQRLARWTLFLFVLAAIMLVGSVVFPAGESGRVLALLDDDERVIEPLRLLGTQLESGLAEETADLQRFALAADSTAPARFRSAASRDDRIAETMRQLAARVGGEISASANSVPALVARWRRLANVDFTVHTPLAAVNARLEERETVRDSIVVTIGRLQSALAERSAEGRSALSAHERRGVVINAAQVVVALIALVAASAVLRRERRLAKREAAVRRAGEYLARALSADDVARTAVDAAMDLLSAARVRVAHVEEDSGQLRLVTAAVSHLSVDDATRATEEPYSGSAIERVVRSGRPAIVAATAFDNAIRAGQRAMLIPLGEPDSPIGAVIAGESPRFRFDRDDLAWARIFGHLVSLSYAKLRLLDEAREGRARLQRVMESRGRLMRGFSHDVKNPLGAADGYAALLEDGIYGAVSVEQVISIRRIRDAIQHALSLIDDLHVLARAETGHLDVRLVPVDIAGLVVATGDEYRAAAASKHLEFVVDVQAGLPRVETDPARLQQIIGNLLSNAIKYTSSGSVTLRARSDVAESSLTAGHVFIDIEDTGPGIPPDKQAFIFDEFARLDGAGHLGAGLGLAISKHVAGALGCQLTVTSVMEEGATFTLCVPALADVIAGVDLRT